MQSTHRLIGYALSGAAVAAVAVVVIAAHLTSVSGAPLATTFTAVDGSRVHNYSSVRELSADAHVVVLARATGTTRVETIEKIPFTVTTMDVLQIWKDSAGIPTQFELRQVGATSVTGHVPLAVTGQTYLLFLQRFTYGPGRDTTQFVVVGSGAGMYLVSGSRASRVDPDSTLLPAVTDVANLHAQVLGSN